MDLLDGGLGGGVRRDVVLNWEGKRRERERERRKKCLGHGRRLGQRSFLASILEEGAVLSISEGVPSWGTIFNAASVNQVDFNLPEADGCRLDDYFSRQNPG